MSELIEIPIMPLHNAVLFPRTLMPLHVSEPRYRKLAADCLEGNRQLGIVLVRKVGMENCANDQCTSLIMHRVLCVGRIVHHQVLADGQFNLKIEGQHRAIVSENIPSWPYRRAKVEIFQDQYDAKNRDELNESRARLEKELSFLGEVVPRFNQAIERILNQGQHPGILADLACTHFVSDLYDRQSILAEFDLNRRVDLTAIQMELLNRRVRRAHRKAT